MNNTRASNAIPSHSIRIWALGVLLLGLLVLPQAKASHCPEVLRHTFSSLQTGQRKDLCQYRGKAIASFCRLTYGVEFPMFEKSSVVGEQRNALFAELQRRTGQQPRWNFHKYLIDSTGEWILRAASGSGTPAMCTCSSQPGLAAVPG
jgi:hypothetical protein